jgi:hypothetical protein
LEIVDTARKEGTHTSGARSGGQIADFLRQEATEVGGENEADGTAILESLAARANASKATTAQPTPAPAADDHDALAELVARPAVAKPSPTQAGGGQAAEAADADDDQDDPDGDVLASLTRR